MVATFTVETGAGVTAANAYLTEAEADTYHDNFGSDAAWDAVTDKELRIREATQYLDAAYGLRWKGDRVSDTQGLDWPRAHVWTRDGFVIESNTIPEELKSACAALALKAESDTLLPDLTTGEQGIQRQLNQVGSLKQDTTFTASKGRYKKYSLVEGLIGDLLNSKSSLVRG